MVLGILGVSAGRARAGEKMTAIAAVPITQGTQGGQGVPGHLVARFTRALPGELRRVGFAVLDPRLADIKLAERPDLLSNCQQEVCLVAQAQWLGVTRLLIPALEPVVGGLRVALALHRTVQRQLTEPETLQELARAAEPCVPCGEEALDRALARAVERLRTAAEAPAALELEPAPAPLRNEGPAGPGGIRPARVAKWVMLSVGVAAIIAGATLWGLDGSPACSRAPGQQRCLNVLDTRNAGIGIFTGGAAALGVAGVLFGVDLRWQEQHPQQQPGARAGAMLTMSGAF